MVGILKCRIVVQRKEDCEKASTVRSLEEKKVGENADENGNNNTNQQGTKKTGIINEINSTFPFRLERKEFLDYIFEMRELKIRAYILQCHGLTAVDSHIDLKSGLVGYGANCSANPYLRLQIGDGENDDGLVRYIDDSKSAVSSSLDPAFKLTYPMDLKLPDDFQLRIDVMSKTLLKDPLIGSTVIDLEDRYYGDAYNQAIISLKLNKKYYTEKLKDEKIGTDKAKRLRRKIDEVNRLRSQVDNFEQRRNIEFRQLKRQGERHTRGTVEMWLDIYPSDTRFPEYNLRAVLQNKYELRLIVWNAYNIPKTEAVLSLLLLLQ